MELNALTRLKRVAGKQTTTLTHHGRKTGNPHEVTIWFVLDGDRLYIGTASVNRQWLRFGGSTGCFDRSSRLGVPSQQRV